MTLQFDEEAARRLEAIYTTPDVVEQRREVLAALGLRPGEAVIDIGSGPGLLAAEMAVEVGRDGAGDSGQRPAVVQVLGVHRRAPGSGGPARVRRILATGIVGSPRGGADRLASTLESFLDN